ncbi:partial Teichoic acid translocation permease protein TagG, partial [Methylococcales bacterium]
MTYSDFFRQIPIFVNLVNSDFSRRYLGTYLGTFWAFAAPISTIGVLLFVFNVGFRVEPTNGVSFDLWLITGLLVWFYITDSIVSGSNSIVEYSFLVKKIRFQTEILPAVKALSSLYVHAINMLLLTCLYLYHSSYPSLAWIQLIYYMLGMVIFVLAVATISSVIMVFFRDFQGVINILMQLGLWGTPI